MSSPVADAWAPVPYRVADRREEVADTVTLDLVPEGGVLPSPAPGQFHMLWAFGVGEAPISVSGTGANGRQTHTVRSVGAVSQALAGAGPGTVLGVRGPFGQGWDVEAVAGGPVVVVAGGLGLAPLRPAIDELVDRGDDLRLVVGARSPDVLLYPGDLESWAQRVPVVRTVDAPTSGWDGDVGLVTAALPRLVDDPATASALLCGPEVMMVFAARALLDLGVRPERIQVSLERNMQCALGHCGRCQLGGSFLCLDGPVLTWAEVSGRLAVPEL